MKKLLIVCLLIIPSLSFAQSKTKNQKTLLTPKDEARMSTEITANTGLEISILTTLELVADATIDILENKILTGDPEKITPTEQSTSDNLAESATGDYEMFKISDLRTKTDTESKKIVSEYDYFVKQSNYIQQLIPYINKDPKLDQKKFDEAKTTYKTARKEREKINK